MKRVLLCTLAVMSLLVTSCKESEDNKVENYIEQIYQAIDRQDFANAVELYKEMRSYLNGLDYDTERKLREELGAENIEKIDKMEDILYQGCKEKGIPFGPSEEAAQEAAEEEAGEPIEDTEMSEPWEDGGVYPETTDSLGEEAIIIDAEADNATEEQQEHSDNSTEQEDTFML